MSVAGTPEAVFVEPVSKRLTSSLWPAWRDTGRLTLRRPGLLLPFLFLAFVELFVLLIVGDTPPPYDALLNPPIRFFYGAAFVNYPRKILILPSLFSHARTVVEVLLGSLVTGWAAARVIHARFRTGKKLWTCLGEAGRRYPTLAAVTLVTLIAGRLAGKGLTLLFGLKAFGHPLFPAAWGLPLLVVVTFAIMTLIDAASIYAVPALVAERRSFFGAIRTSLSLFRARPWTTLLLVGLPGLPFFAASVAASLSPVLFGLRSPDKIAQVFFLNIGIALVARYLITVSTAVAYAGEREKALESRLWE